LALYASNATHFQHQDWLGTERMRTTYNGSVEGSYTSLPFGDGQAATGSDLDANHFATLDHDNETDTDHAQFRQFANAQGRWMRPDPYSGSYDASNPQSFNRYVYASNNPLAMIDPSGLDDVDCVDNNSCPTDEDGTAGGGGDICGNNYYPGPSCTVTVSGTDPGYCNMDDPNCQVELQQIEANTPEEDVNPGTEIWGGGTAIGPSYSRADICAASAVLNKGLPTFLDALGLIPGEGSIAAGIQFGAGILSAAMSNGPADVGLSAGGLGLTTLDSGLKSQGRQVAVNLFGKSIKIIPLLGIGVSAYSTYRDVYGEDGMNAYYDNCMAGKN
jgi:RHS repeat-associated protein